MRFSNSVPYSVLTMSALIALGACTQGPWPIPRGYSSYDQVYKSAPGPKARDIGYEYSNKNNERVLKELRYAARDLVKKLDDKLSMNVDGIYLKVQDDNAFYNSFDHLLREELNKQGYRLLTSPVNALRIDFLAKEEIPECTAVERVEDDGAYKTLYLALAINSAQGVPQDFVGDYYEVPTYGFTHIYDFEDIGKSKIDLPLCPEDSQVIDLEMAIREHKTQSAKPDEIKVIEEDLAGEIAVIEIFEHTNQKNSNVSDIVSEILSAGQEKTDKDEENTD
ncbi:MAG: hypothetical protein ACLFP8_05315 [Alphaproteobacteria bacterium]